MKNIIIYALPLFLLSGCYGQTDTTKKHTLDEAVKPKVDYKVNKEYDENGNLIKFDSTYTYYYSNIDKSEMINDSIFNKFNKHFSLKKPLIDDSFFNEFFKRENYLESDFFSEDFFRSNINRNSEIIEKMLKRMDSLKNQFMVKEYPLKEEK